MSPPSFLPTLCLSFHIIKLLHSPDEQLFSFSSLTSFFVYVVPKVIKNTGCSERGKRDVYCDKQVEKVVTVLNCMLKDSWGEVGSRGIRKKLKSKYTAYLESKYRKNDGSSI